eukprot:CAMPEP_0180245136 /NCGR_PEP_ID=MMETSP0987-20121128/34825_1 /TAXON_ID=697907 /ORGANISM="non described non described, Strain CCMP2293" /LENGTH=39 /DNA_ID= /DNA_START= /DNA_END= /DNA_ORIENTATION=
MRDRARYEEMKSTLDCSSGGFACSTMYTNTGRKSSADMG